MLELPNIQCGASIIIQKEIRKEDTALNYGSGKLENLLATPSLVALMIEGAVKLVDDRLPEGIITVGKKVFVEHEKPTRLGETVSVRVEIKGFDGVKITFDMQAFDEVGLVGKGNHERWIVNKNALLKKANNRSSKLKDNNY